MKPLIWLVEDEPSIADTLIYTLESEGFTLRWFDRGSLRWQHWLTARQH